MPVGRIAVGLLLLIAAGLKLADPLPRESNLLSGFPWLFAIVIQFEFFLGLALVFGPFTRTLWILTFVTFLVFSVVSLSKLIAGHDSCGCFGAVSVHPIWSLLIDLGALGLIAVSRPTVTALNCLRPQHFGRLLLLFSVSMFIAAWADRLQAAAKLREEIALLELTPGGRIALSPSDWIGRRLPLTNAIEGIQGLEAGHWTLLLFSDTCPSCRKAAREFDRRATTGSGERICLVRVGPVQDSAFLETLSHCSIGSLTETVRWIIELPTEIKIVNGFVTSVRRPAEIVE